MTKEEADQITAVKVELAALTAEIREQNKTLFEITHRHEKVLSGDHEAPGIGTRVALLEGFSARAKAVIAAVGLTILGLVANAIKSFVGAE
ncbi:hypothetical protein [Gimesia fumaroli]|uniref:Uncharacterized protein n=1 Tax=Gimesia fumaroli TaxID=2527976 RepID=A0A518IKV9_9PLAN|nr:hypothetical protein [Gimesia fumaroli]QDV53714.1 hypothetical protein Enr17x_57950 [Gimesia fumaroli]